MALFGKRGRGAADDWTPVAIHIVKAVRPHDHREGMSSTTWDALVDLVSDSRGVPYAFMLRVQPAEGPAYQIEHQERVPMSAVAPGLSVERKIPDGVDVRGWARIDDPTTVAIDWTSYATEPESKAAVEDARQVEADRVYAEKVLAKMKPKQQEQHRASAWAGTSSLAAGVRDGAVSREVWERQAQGNLRRTLITPEQYAEAIAIIEGR